MTDPVKMKIDIDATSVEATTAAFNKLKIAIEAVNAELEKLGSKPHGGIIINAVGHLVQAKVKPAPRSALVVHEEIINRDRNVG